MLQHYGIKYDATKVKSNGDRYQNKLQCNSATIISRPKLHGKSNVKILCTLTKGHHLKKTNEKNTKDEHETNDTQPRTTNIVHLDVQ